VDNEKYTGKWVWNKTESRRDPRTGRRRRFTKPESKWVVREEDSLRIVPQEILGEGAIAKGRGSAELARREGTKGFLEGAGGRERQFLTHLLSGTMTCGSCGAAIAEVSGKSGGYYGCLAAGKGACENKMLVRRTLVEKIIVTALRERLASPDNVRHVLLRVEEEVTKLYAHIPETIRMKETELSAEERRLANFLDLIGDGRGSKALGQALVEAEKSNPIRNASLRRIDPILT
jgi:hypothetical protein